MPNLEHYYKKKLEELKAQPVRVFALVYPYVLVVGLIIGLSYVANINQVARARVPAVPPDTTKITELKVVEAKTVPPVDIMTASKPTPELIDKGKQIYTTVCQSCHGADGRGDGPASIGLNPAPRNYTSPEGWKNGPKLSQIYKTLQEGLPGSAMAAYDYLLPEEKIGLAHYIRQTFVSNPPQDTPDDLTTLDQTYQLSKGQEISAQIPVSNALEIVTNENENKVKKIEDVLNLISKDSGEEGSRIFNMVTTNKIKALGLLSRSSEWKGNQQVFISSIINDVNQNGFNGNIYKLNSNEWNALQSYMSKYF